MLAPTRDPERWLQADRNRQQLIALLTQKSFLPNHAVQLLFGMVCHAYGEQAARLVFGRYGKPVPEKLIEDLALLDRLEIMNPRSMRQLAREIAASSNKISFDTALTHIKRLKRKHPQALTPIAELQAMRKEIRRIAKEWREGDISGDKMSPGTTHSKKSPLSKQFKRR
jgi:hypothetical protein